MHITINMNEMSFIDTTIHMKNGEGRIHITWIYGNTKWEERLILWDKLRAISNARLGSWMCVGDFNEIASEAEKEGVRPKQQRMMDALNVMIQG